ncbi:MAG: peptidoglycan-binding protein [Spirulinaceae cyanobacterium RM2_2_10]|nr:peptidoglycan-binding protein [Spirulinaceae cyanobacterium SM2_1_0]NJO19834.1 peptidoglycan-binding protein [Spirulinaceae cyanobacterium RM2_2_10]
MGRQPDTSSVTSAPPTREPEPTPKAEITTDDNADEEATTAPIEAAEPGETTAATENNGETAADTEVADSEAGAAQAVEREEDTAATGQARAPRERRAATSAPATAAGAPPAAHSVPAVSGQPRPAAPGSAPERRIDYRQLPPRVTFRPLLQRGDHGYDVALLQKLLASLGYYDRTVDGDFGHLTAGAVEAFQRDRNLAVDGIVGFSTCNILRTLAIETGAEPLESTTLACH